MRGVVLLFACLALGLVVVGPAAAHAELLSASPAPGAQLAESPAEIRLTFSEPVATTSAIVLLAEGFQPVEGLVGQFSADRPQEIFVPLPELAAGVYTVQWTAASGDGHEISGTYSFSVGLVTPGVATVAPTAAAAQTEQDGGSGVGWWLGGLLAVAVGAPLLIVALRRARR